VLVTSTGNTSSSVGAVAGVQCAATNGLKFNKAWRCLDFIRNTRPRQAGHDVGANTTWVGTMTSHGRPSR